MEKYLCPTLWYYNTNIRGALCLTVNVQSQRCIAAGLLNRGDTNERIECRQ